MKKLLIVNNNMHIGGVQKALIGLLWSIRDRYEVTLVLLYPGGEYLNQIPSEVTVIPAGGGYRYIGMTRDDPKTVADRLGRAFFGGISRIFGRKYAVSLMALGQRKLMGFDVAISYLHSGGDRIFYGGCNEFVLRHVVAKRKITFLHCDYPGCGADTRENGVLYSRFDAIAACSQGCARAFLSCHPQREDRLWVVPNCHRFQRIREEAQEASVAFPADRVNLVTVARLGQEKGVDRALEVLGKLNTVTNWHYHIVGGGVQEPWLRRRVAELGLEECVTFHGLQKNPYGYLRAADLLWIPSRNEAAPMVIGEAAALGTPVFSTETASAREMIQDMGYGWVCENTEPAMARMLETLLADPAMLTDAKARMAHIRIDNTVALQALEACLSGDGKNQKESGDNKC